MTPGEFILIPLAASALFVGVVAWIIWKNERVRPPNQCPKCGYDLQGRRNDGCSECGWNTRTPARRL